MIILLYLVLLSSSPLWSSVDKTCRGLSNYLIVYCCALLEWRGLRGRVDLGDCTALSPQPRDKGFRLAERQAGPTLSI